MENLHLKNLNRKDIIDDCIKLKEAADENNDEKIEYCINNISFLYILSYSNALPSFLFLIYVIIISQFILDCQVFY